MLRLTNAENTMTSLTIIIFNQLQLKSLVCMASRVRLIRFFWADTDVFQFSLLMSDVLY